MAQKDSCIDFAMQQSSLFALAGLGTGFFRAHAHSKTVSIADKRALAANFLKTAKIMVPPTLYYGAIGVAFSGTQCAVEKINGERDAVSGILGGVAAGAVVGLRNGSLPGAIGFGMLFAGASLLTDFFTNFAQPVLGTMVVKPPPVPAQQ